MTISIENLRCEYLVDPTAIERVAPRLSWEVASNEKNVKQMSYRVLVASSADSLSEEKLDLWDSGIVESSAQNQITYKGKPLTSFQDCFWKVILYVSIDGCDSFEVYSDTAFWKMGILEAESWQGAYISAHCEGVKDATYLRKEFSLNKQVKSACLYATAKGIFELYLNGEKVDEELFAPGWTNYKAYTYYRAYDVTNMIADGENCIGSILGDGWFKGAIGFSGACSIYGNRLMMLVNLRVEYCDGTVETIASNGDWKVSYGPILQSSFLYGENYDARQELGDWSSVRLDASDWKQADEHSFDKTYWDNKDWKMVEPGLRLKAHPCPPVRPICEFPAKEFWSTMPGSYVFDLGRNFAGYVRLKVNGKPGQMIRLRFAEVLNPDRTLYVENLRSASSTDTYICKGTDEEVWEPKFTFHGFQYVEVTGVDEPSLDTVLGIAISSDIEKTGSFRCSNEEVNTLYDNTYWTQRANFIEIPTDCPQRDERLGWTGDALAFVNAAAYNTDISAFFTKWLKDLRDTAHEDGSVANVAPSVIIDSLRADAAWADAIVGCPWAVYKFYDDKTVLRDNYEAMKGHVKYYKETSENLIRKSIHCFGDWLSDNAHTPNAVIQTAFFAKSIATLSEVAKLLGEDEDAEKYKNLADEITVAFNKEFISADGIIKGDTQTCYIIALAFDLLEVEKRDKAVEILVERIKERGWKLSTGFIGTSMLMPTLSRFGKHDVAYKLLLQAEYPSWLFPIRNGATSIWERWNGWTPTDGPGDSSMNSYSHYSFGAVVEWMYRTIAGIDMTKPGFEEISIAPVPGGELTWVECSYHSIRGTIVSNWKIEDGTFALNVTIPPNTTAKITMPGVLEPERDAHVVADLKTVDDKSTFTVGSGVYRFRSIAG
ncbi:MAG: family 78 glycoside hydrolase catalytic domain [Kiritimatiellae bacterium]|jgi:alpha-L-rhamnosidase|nr:family 78 glycoside hydrolase catalytic domain [Kiritimatiellia bacterium]